MFPAIFSKILYKQLNNSLCYNYMISAARNVFSCAKNFVPVSVSSVGLLLIVLSMELSME